VAKQIVTIYAATSGRIDDVDVSQVRRFEAELIGYIENSHADLYGLIGKEKALTDTVKARLDAVIAGFRKVFA
jgi:F-type H+-transporting ATPase subunit alpha